MTLGEALRQLARTAALVAVAAALLLAVTAWVAETPGAEFLFGLTLAAPLAALAFWQAAEALRTGELPHRLGVDRRERNPTAYWTGLGILALGALLAGALALWCVVRLLAG